MRTVLITGAGGFIGSHVVDAFRVAGWQPIALIRRHCSPALQALLADGSVQAIHGDATAPDASIQALRQRLGSGQSLDAIAHCAGRATDVGRKHHFEHDNVDALRGTIDLFRACDARRLVLVSSTDVYGMRDFHGESEDQLPLCDRPGNAYPATKIRAETLLKTSLPAACWSIIRPAAVWGPGDTTQMSRIVDFLRWSPWIVHFGSWRGQNRWPLAHVRNVATAVRVVTEVNEAAGKTYNVLDSEYTSVDAFTGWLPQSTFQAGIFVP